MATVRHLAHAAGRLDSTPYRVSIRTGKHQLVADEPAALGGGDVGPSPLGLLVSALAACTANTLRMYAEHKGWELSAIDVDVRYNAGDEGRSIARVITLAAGVPAEQRRKLAEVAERTPVTLAVGSGTAIATTFK
jgi:putative redox protein